MSLTQEQLRAVQCDASAIVVFAGAGSGKTETVARRVLRLLEQSQGSERILALSYTNKAAGELRERLRSRTGALSEAITTETIHSFAFSIVRQHGTTLGFPLEPEVLTTDADRAELLARWRDSEGLDALENPLHFFSEVDLDRARLRTSEAVSEWRDALASLPALDYPALLDAATELVQRKSVGRLLARTYRHVIVDEAQNLTPAQYQLITALVPRDSGASSLMLVGDDKQSIVSFAGADPSLMRRFASERSALIFPLTKNFRSAAQISRLADRVARELGQSPPGEREAHAAPGLVRLESFPNEASEAEGVANWVRELLDQGLPPEALAPGENHRVRREEIAVLARAGTGLRATASALTSADVPFSMAQSSQDWLESAGGRFLLELIAFRAVPEHASTRWRLAKLLNTSDDLELDEVAIRRLLTTSSSDHLAGLLPLLDAGGVEDLVEAFAGADDPGASPAELAARSADIVELRDAWREFTNVTDGIARTWSNFRAFCSKRHRDGSSADGVQLLTIHRAQGREFRAVALIGLNDGQLPDFRAKSADDITSELRAFYVAISRAQRCLLLTRSKRRSTRYGERATDASRFLDLVV